MYLMSTYYVPNTGLSQDLLTEEAFIVALKTLSLVVERTANKRL